MNSSRALIILLFVTIIAVAGAVLVLVREQASISSDIETALLFPDLGSRLGEVAELRIDGAMGSVIITWDGEQWTLPGKSGYPADQGRVRAAILAAARIDLLETKTADPALYARLGLQDPDQEGSRAQRLSLSNEAGRTLAAVLIGDRPSGSGVYSSAGRATGRAYVRRPDEAQSWLASDVPDLSADTADWLDDQLLSLVQERVKRITVRHADGTTIRVYRDSPAGDNGADDAFSIADLPSDRRVRAADGPASLAMGLAFLSFDDVKPADSLDWSDANEVVFTAFDGLEITVRLKDSWAHFSAIYDTAVAEEDAGGAVLPPSPPDGAAEARRINERYGKWAYKLPTYKAEDLVPALDDLTEAISKDKGL